jgi:hypothetical protein
MSEGRAGPPTLRRCAMRRRLLTGIVLVGIVAMIPDLADAKTSTVSSKSLVSGTATVAACGNLAAVVTNFTISSSMVTSVILASIPSTCNGGSLIATVTNSATSLGAGGPVTVAAGTATVPISPAAPTGSVTHVRIVIVGP